MGAYLLFSTLWPCLSLLHRLLKYDGLSAPFRYGGMV